MPSDQQNSNSNSKFEKFCNLISAATEAETSNNYDVAISMYIAAYQIGKDGGEQTVQNAIRGLQNAWNLAIKQQNRPVCEQIFGLLEDNLTDDEVAKMSDELNALMLNKLSGLGLSLGEIADDMDIDKVMNRIKNAVEGKAADGPIDVEFKANEGYAAASDTSIAKRIEAAKNQSANTSKNVNESSKNISKEGSTTRKKDNDYQIRKQVIKYKDIVGYDDAINEMKRHGLGVGADTQYSKLVETLNKEHGLHRVAFTNPLVFRSNSRYDAKMFMEATVGEIGLPCMRMRVDENIHGANVLCVMMPNEGDFKLNPGRTGFFGRGIIALEDLDLWDLPEVEQMPNLPEDEEALGRMISAHARNSQLLEIYNLIEVALSDPDVMLVANVTNDEAANVALSRFFDDYDVVDVDLPSVKERAAIWTTLANDHPSLRAFSTQKLVSFSDKMSRYDIEVAVHDALEEAYKQGIAQRQYVPLSITNLIEKLAEHQDPESRQYRELEDAAAEDFSRGLGNLDDILK